MANKQGVIDAVLAYVPAGMHDEAKIAASSLVDSAVESIGLEFAFRYRESKKDDYAITDSSRTHDLPSGAISIIRMGTVADGRITEKFYPFTETAYADRGMIDSSFGNLHYMPLAFDENTSIRQFTVVGTLGGSRTVRVVYLREPDKNDIRFLSTLVVALGVMRVFPSKFLNKDTLSADRNLYVGIYDQEIRKMIMADEDSMETPMAFGQDPTVVATNSYLRKI